LYVDPLSPQALRINRTYTLDVRIANVTDLYAWEFKLYYKKAIVNATRASEGPFLSAGGSTLMTDTSNPNYNSTHGLVSLADSLFSTSPGVNGSGVIAHITFKGLSQGNSTLQFGYAALLNNTGDEVPYVALHSYLSVIAVHDIKVSDVKPYKNVTCQGYSMFLNVTLQNQGDFSESSNVTLYYGAQTIGTQPVTNLAPNATRTLTMTWNTTGVAKGNYTISAYAQPVQGETNVTNNHFTDSWVYISMEGDINADGRVNLVDLYAVSHAYNSVRGTGGLFWHTPHCSSCPHKPNCDINNDGVVNSIDYNIVVRNFGKIDP